MRWARGAHSRRTEAEALEVAAEHHPDVVLLDIGMPKLGRLRSGATDSRGAWGKGAVLIALTGWGQDEDRRRSREVGFDSHLVKPLDPEALATLLARLPIKAMVPEKQSA